MPDPKSTYKPDLSIGDSIAKGLQDLGGAGIGGDARVGAMPGEVLRKVKKLAESGTLKDKNVVLSSGLSNDPQASEFKNIEEQLKVLKSTGAHITLLGVSNENAELAPFNDRLKALAEKYGATFAPLPSTEFSDKKHHIHPSSKELYKNIVEANTGGHKDAPAASVPQLSTEDALKVQGLIKKINDQGKEHYDLGKSGKNHDGVDGDMGNLTKDAFRQFEITHNLNGKVDKDTLIKALEQSAGETAKLSLPEGKVVPLQVPSGNTPAVGKASRTV
jgi:hypothetical protein